MTDNCIGDEGAAEIAGALKVNTAITRINLGSEYRMMECCVSRMHIWFEIAIGACRQRRGRRGRCGNRGCDEAEHINH